MPGNDAPRGPALVAAILGSAGRPIADQPGRHVWGEPAAHAAAGTGQALGRRLRSARTGTVRSSLRHPRHLRRRRDWNCRSSMSGCGRCRGWCAMPAGADRLAPAAPAPGAPSPSACAFSARTAAGLRLELHAGAGEPRVVPDRRGRRRSLHPGHAGGGAGPQAGAAALRSRGAMPCLGLLNAGGNRSRVAAGPACASRPAGAKTASVCVRRCIGARSDPPTTANRAPARRCTMPVRRNGRGAARSRVRETVVGRLPGLAVPAARGNRRRRPSPSSSQTSGSGELWTRRIGGRVMRSRQFIGVRKPSGWIVERFGSPRFRPRSAASANERARARRCAACAAAACHCRARCGRRSRRRSRKRRGASASTFRSDCRWSAELVRYRGWLTDR